MAYEKRSFRITKPEEQPANTRWNAAFFLYMHGLLVCGWCSLYMIFHAAREAYVGICNGTHAVAHSGTLCSWLRHLMDSRQNEYGTYTERRRNVDRGWGNAGFCQGAAMSTLWLANTKCDLGSCELTRLCGTHGLELACWYVVTCVGNAIVSQAFDWTSTECKRNVDGT